MIALYSNLFISKFGAQDSGTWFEVLKDLTPRALENGLETLRCGGDNGKFVEFPPNAVQFRKLCLAYYASLDLPSVDEAYQQIRGLSNKNRPHTAVKFTAKQLGPGFFEIENERKAHAVFKKMYLKVCHLARLGHTLPETPGPLFVEKPRTPSVAFAALKALKQHVGAPSCRL